MAYESYGKGVYGTRLNAGPPSAGSNEVQTLTFGGTWAPGDTFRLSYEGRLTAVLSWSAVNATLLAAIQAGLDAITGTSWIVATAGTLTTGLGTVLLTFSGGDVSHRNVNSVAVPNVTSAAGTLTNAETTPGVTATARDAQPGTTVLDTTNSKLYINTGPQGAPVWTVVGAQS
jgi:hypothetical protein